MYYLLVDDLIPSQNCWWRIHQYSQWDNGMARPNLERKGWQLDNGPKPPTAQAQRVAASYRANKGFSMVSLKKNIVGWSHRAR